ncbi:MAG: phage holin family protein [Mobiluncus sp.]|uniref:phage holin family protein n=1 Tax=Mobiluncus sp. TaxID=47293 RepID=UPI002584F67E|nr:phage holin family protein [Mobiluncus sp.]MCI6584993.1 phage holin family protein [Mobiluncus sp.]
MSDDQKATMGMLFSRFSAQISTLFRAEIALAKAQAKESGKRFGLAAGLFAVAGVLALFMLGWLIQAMFFGWLALTGANWGAALLTALVLLVITGILAGAGIASVKKAQEHIPDPASGVKTDVGIIKSAIKSQPEGETHE